MEVTIIGAGIAGLSAAYHLENHNIKYNIFEKNLRPGGLCKTEKTSGFLFDYTGHLLHFKNEYARTLVLNMLKNNINKHSRKAWIYSKGVYTPYPFQLYTYGLPISCRLECLIGLIIKKVIPQKYTTFRGWIHSKFGYGIAKHFMEPYNKKLWQVRLDTLTTDWVNRFGGSIRIRDALQGAFFYNKHTIGYNAEFYYPIRGGIESIIHSFLRKVAHVKKNKTLIKLNLKKKQVIFNDKKIYHFDHLISTIPLPELIMKIENAPHIIKESAKQLRWISVYNLNLVVKNHNHTKHWVYLPEKEFNIYRFGFSSNFYKTNTPDKSIIYTEISYLPNVPLPSNINERIINDLIKAGVIKDKEDIFITRALNIPYAYILFDNNHARCVKNIQEFLIKNNIYSIGRFGGWNYGAIEEAIMDGKKIADIIKFKVKQT